MSQTNIYEYLKKERLCGNEEYYSAKEIGKILGIGAINSVRNCNKLAEFGFLDKKLLWGYCYSYRLSDKELSKYKKRQ